MDRGVWVVRVYDRVYVWPRGQFVQMYGFGEYVRRLSGEVQDAQPFRAISVPQFQSRDHFRRWCRIHANSLPNTIRRHLT